jgi:hypothetical protein
VLARSEAVSPACAQEDLRPDLVPRRVDILPGADRGQARYAVQVRNVGATDSGAFELRLDVAGRPPVSGTVAPLTTGATRVVALAGPACAAGDAVTVMVDAGGEVDEVDEAGNALTTPCPPA